MLPMDDAEVGVEIWHYMALKMAIALREMADGTFHTHHFQPGILADANRFLGFAVQISRQRLFGWTPQFPAYEQVDFEATLHRMRLSYLEKASNERTGRDAADFDRELIVLADFMSCFDRPGRSREVPSKKSILWAAAFFEALTALSER